MQNPCRWASPYRDDALLHTQLQLQGWPMTLPRLVRENHPGGRVKGGGQLERRKVATPAPAAERREKGVIAMRDDENYKAV